MSTKITTRTVRIMLSHNYSNFEFISTLENENDVPAYDIEQEGKVCQKLAEDAVNAYIQFLRPQKNVKEELKQIENKIESIKAVISEKTDLPEITDPKEIAEIEKLPMYPTHKNTKAKK